ncbi:cytochrome b5 reductase 4 isoform X3 [Daktulosphaira vitifoliae]|uniref:cytochrome b5 reductase 4 isoform X3 n=1 Tax=Daktulosphaira vitifoliae TaxID=58002 RepID=UPI0021AAFEDB|nr:cytochrome b5 reductase 4 isoform X3 [Daktulosphaira vitifoliae]
MATGTNRNKVALAPGHSLMDWIRLGNSGNDLSGVGGKLISVSRSELAKHNKKNDAWLAIRGTVYNVTHYMDFHPGGVDELVRGIGTDATKLFSEIHAWVNYESILQKCIIGRLVNEEIYKLPEVLKSAIEDDLKIDWFQQLNFLCFVFYTKTPYPEVSMKLKSLSEFDCTLNGITRCVKLHSNIKWPFNVKVVAETGKVQIKLFKKNLALWPTFGSISVAKYYQINYWKCTLSEIYEVTHNVNFLLFKYEENVYNHVYPGQHVYIKANLNVGNDVSRPYTPVWPLVETSKYGQILEDKICFLVKTYTHGKLSQYLYSLHPGDNIEVSKPQGLFKFWTSKKSIIMLAAGTGLTPMVPIIWNALHSSIKVYNVTLLYWNKTKKCIIWKDHLDKLCANYLQRFAVHYMVTNDESLGNVHNNRIDELIIDKYVPEVTKNSEDNNGICICGPSGFNQLCEKLIIQKGYSPEDYFVFG